MFFLSPFGRKTQFKMAATYTNYYAKNGISSPISMKIINTIYEFVCLEGQGILISQNKTYFKRFFALLVVKDELKPAFFLGCIYYIN